MSFVSITNILNKKLPQTSPLSKQVTASLVCEEFDKWIIKKWADLAKDQARALYLKDNILTIASLSSVLAQEIRLNETEILDFLNYKFSIKIEKIRYLT